MADLTYKVTVDTQTAERNLERLQTTIRGISDTFVRLSTVIGTVLGAALTTGIANAISYADRINDLSEASGIAIENIVGFGQAVQAAGGSAEGAERGLLKFINSIGEAANGSRETQQAFGQVGVSLRDLATLSEQDILAKTIRGLGSIGDSATQARLKTQLLGKEFRGVSMAGLSDGYQRSVDASREYADAIRSAAATQDQLDRTINNFRLVLLDTIRPLLELVNSINVSTESIKRFFAVLAGAALAAAGFIVVVRAITLLRAAIALVVTSWGQLTAAVGTFVTYAGNFIRNWQLILLNIRGASSIFSGIKAALVAVGISIMEAIGPAVAFLQSYATPIIAAFGAIWGYVEGSVSGVINRVKELLAFLGLIDGTAPEIPEPPKPDIEGERQRREIINKSAQDMARFREQQRASIEDLSRDLVARNNRVSVDNSLLMLNGRLTNITEDQLEQERLRNRLTDERTDKVQALNDQIDRLRLEGNLGLDENAGAKIAIIQANILKLKDAYDVFIPRQVELLQNTQDIRRVEEDRRRTLDNLNKSIEDSINRNQGLGDTLKSINDQMRETNFAGSLIGRGQLEKDIAGIRESSRRAALEAGRAYAAAFEDTGDGLTPERAIELRNGLDRIAQGYSQIAQAQVDNLMRSREWNAGWNEAFINYADNAKNAADRARSYFETFTRGFETLISDLVTKGKANWRDFANSIIAEFARIQARQMLLNLFGTGGGSGGLLTSLVGTVFPAFGSPAQQFAGGLIPMAAGGYVTQPTAALVGEAGPEAIIPLAQMENLGAGQQITYNINAVDAASFKALIARDPGFIHAVAEAGRRSQPTRRQG